MTFVTVSHLFLHTLQYYQNLQKRYNNNLPQVIAWSVSDLTEWLWATLTVSVCVFVCVQPVCMALSCWPCLVELRSWTLNVCCAWKYSFNHTQVYLTINRLPQTDKDTITQFCLRERWLDIVCTASVFWHGLKLWDVKNLNWIPLIHLFPCLLMAFLLSKSQPQTMLERGKVAHTVKWAWVPAAWPQQRHDIEENDTI